VAVAQPLSVTSRSRRKLSDGGIAMVTDLWLS
jgi:hypothetical protein